MFLTCYLFEIKKCGSINNGGTKILKIILFNDADPVEGAHCLDPKDDYHQSVQLLEEMTTTAEAEAPVLVGEKDDGVIRIQRRILTGKDRFAITSQPFITDTTNDVGRRYGTRKPHLEGLRGILGFFTLLAIFFRTFAPAIQTDTDLNGLFPADFVLVAPQWQNTLRKVLGPIFWDSTLLPHFFIILSGRVTLQSKSSVLVSGAVKASADETLAFLERRLALPMAATAFHRPFRLLPNLVVCLTVTSILSATHSFDAAFRMATDLRSSLAAPPQVWSSSIEYFNTLAALFFAEPAFTYQDRPFSFVQPVGVLFVVPIIFQQTFTCITAAYILPYTKLKPKVIGYTAFVLLCYWVGSWAWYSLTGLAIAEFVSVYSQATPSRFPLRLGRYLGTHKVPVWVPFSVLLITGLAQKWAWASFPERRSDEYMAHTDILTGGLVRSENIAVTPFPRIDDWMVITAILVLIEIFETPRRFLSQSVFRHLGRLAFCESQ